MHVMEFTQAQCLLSELLQLRIEFFGLSCIAHPDAAAVAAAFRDILHKELLDGIGLIEKDVSCHVGVAEAATGQIAVYTVVAVQDRSCRQH